MIPRNILTLVVDNFAKGMFSRCSIIGCPTCTESSLYCSVNVNTLFHFKGKLWLESFFCQACSAFLVFLKKISSIGQSQIQKKTRRIRNVNSKHRPEKYTTVFLRGLIKRYLALNHFVPIQQGKTCTLAD